MCRATVRAGVKKPYAGKRKGLGSIKAAAHFVAEIEKARDESRPVNLADAEAGINFSSWSFTRKTKAFLMLSTSRDEAGRLEHHVSLLADLKGTLRKLKSL